MTAYLRPATLDEALAIRAGEDVTVLAGGTDVYPAKAARAGWGDMRHADMLDITAIAGPARHRRGAASAGASARSTTWTDADRAPAAAAVRRLKLAAREVGGAQIQNRGTLAGNICTASPAGDGIPNLLALDAEVELASRRGRRVVPIARLHRRLPPHRVPRRRDRHRAPRAEAASGARAATSSSSARGATS